LRQLRRKQRKPDCFRWTRVCRASRTGTPAPCARPVRGRPFWHLERDPQGGWAVPAGQAGRGIGRALCQHSLDAARAADFLAMQFNFVVSTNTRAVDLWQTMGFAIVGTVPKAFRHRELGLVDVHLMHRFL
jgi:Acetyltransferase (GNAT) family